MRRTALITCIGVAFGCGAAFASGDVKIAAGEHGSYSRVVVPGGASNVRFDAAERIVQFALPNAVAAVDLSDITGKHKARRIKNAVFESDGGARVRLTLSCACDVTSFDTETGKTVIDIADPKVSAPAPAAKEEPANAAEQEISVEEARARMRTLLQRAADEGFVTLRGEEASPAEEIAEKPAVAETAPSPQKPTENETPDEPASAPQIAVACQPDEAFAIDGGAFDSDPLAAIAEYRARLEEARPEEKFSATDEFVRGYLSIGFGEEALALLRDVGEEDMLLGDLARVVAEQSVPPNGPLMGAAECVGAHALWQAAVAEPEASARAAARSGSAISALPSRLRAILGARIAKKLIEAGAWSTAKAFYAAAAEHGEYAAHDLQYVAARLLEHDGQGAEAEKLLIEVASGDSQASQDALIALAERYAAEGAAPDEEFVEDLGALARRAKGSPKGGAAALHEALIWVASGNVEAGVFLLQSAADADETIAAQAALEAQKAIAASFASNDRAQRLAGLRALMNYRSLIERGGPDPAIRFEAAQTAVDAGLPNLALRLLDDVSANNNRAVMLYKARAALAAGQAESALAVAAPYADEPGFTEIVVTANLQLERHYAALAAASALPEENAKAETMAEAAWRAGDFASVARAYRSIDPSRISAPEALRYALSAYMAGETEIPPAVEAALNRNGAGDLSGLKNLFLPHTDGPILERGQAMAESADAEIELIREILSHG